jgi:DNA-binding FadR family transcriptional regulator
VSLSGHEKIAAAIRRRDPDGAAAAMRDHIKQIADLFELHAARGSSEHRSVPNARR